MIPDLLRRAAGNAVAGDPYYSAVSLLLHFNGANGSTTFTDSSSNNLTVTPSGNAQISTAQSKFGGASGAFDGNGDTLTAPASSLFAFGTGDFTIEAWLYSLDTGSSQRGIFDTRTTIYGAGVMLRENPSGFMVWANGGIVVSTSTGRNPNTWQHVAVVRKGTTLTLYVDGVSSASATFSADLTENGCRVSGFVDTQASPYGYNGYIDDLRITKGVARYTANFTVPSAPYPDRIGSIEADAYFPQTSLLLHMDGTNASTSFVDSGPNALAVTASGNAQISTAQSKFGGASGAFDGNGDYLTVASSAPFAFGTGDFTIELWAYFNTTTGTQGLADAAQSTTAPTASNWWLVKNSANKIEFGFHFGTASSTTSTSSVTQGVWTHIAVSRAGTSLRLFINGTIEATSTNSLNITAQQLQVGLIATPSWLNGYIDDLRITKGVARLTSNFTPRAKAFPDNYNPYKTLPVSGAALWLAGDDSSSLFTDAGVTPVKVNGDLVYQWNDKSGNNRHATQTTSGNRPTWVPPASGRNGLGAFSFNGSQWLTVASPNANFGTSDFTIEMWIKSNDIASLKTPIGTLTSGSDGGWQVVQSSSRFGFGIGVGGGIETYGSTITADTWYHFAISRSGTTLRIFYNGIIASTITNSSNISQTGSMNVGWSNEAAQTGRRFNGQIQNLLIYKGQALYTSNFTPWMS